LICKQITYDKIQKFLSYYLYKKKDANRIDISDFPFISIDGYSAKDFDDAIYVKKNLNNNYSLFIAISDVSYYIMENSYFDKKAYEICNSIYFPDSNISMFPYFLSNYLCSLMPNKTRLSILCEATMNKQGMILKYEFHKAKIRSKMDFTYDEINNIILKKILNKKKDYQKLKYLNRKKSSALKFYRLVG